MPLASEILAMTSLSSRSAANRIASLVTAINVLVASGFSIAGLVSPKSILPAGYVPTEDSSIFAMYAAARTIPLAVMALIRFYSAIQLNACRCGLMLCFVQLLDTGVGV